MATPVFRSPSFQVTPPQPTNGGTMPRKDKVQASQRSGPPLQPTREGDSSISHPGDGESILSLTSSLAPNADSMGGHLPRRDKASQVLGIRHRRSMEPAPTARVTPRPSNVSAHSASYSPPQVTPPPIPLASLYVVSGLPKSPATWTLADPDSVLGLHHSEGAVCRWWRAEVLGSTVSPGCIPETPVPGKKKRKNKEEGAGSAIGLGKQDVGKMLSKALKLSFTREVEIIASTLQPASTVHTFSFSIPASSTSNSPSSLLRSSVISNATASTFPYDRGSQYNPYLDASQPRPSSAYLGPLPTNTHDSLTALKEVTVPYYGVCLTVWSHADQERSLAIRRTLEAASRARKESGPIPSSVGGRGRAPSFDPNMTKNEAVGRGPWSGTDAETDAETEGEGASESDIDSNSKVGESTLFLPGDTVFWLPYALSSCHFLSICYGHLTYLSTALVSRYPIYDLMRDYLTLSWARFSKDVQSHTLQISKILSHPAPKAGEMIKLDASPKEGQGDGSLEVVCRMPGGLDFSRGLVDVNFTMWPLFRCLSLDNVLTLCEIALAPTGRVLFLSRHPAMLGIAVSTIRYLVELRGWSGICLPLVHARDSKIYLEDPGPWLIGLSTEARYAVRPASEVCVCDLDINYVNCATPPPGAVSNKQQRERYRRILSTAFDSYFHPDHSVPSEFKEAFPAGRFRPLCKIQSKRGASASVVADSIKAPEWWHSTRVIQAFDNVLQDKTKKPSLLKRLVLMGVSRRQAQLTAAEQLIQLSIRKRATAFVDARDDLETKIGRLSRRLNFLMTESDLWREKFITFEQYAEKLSNEAAELRAKINKEQRESKRLSSLISLTGQEKARLQNQLSETESAHHDALVELQKMKAAMEKMEEERAQMVAEVEAQIERALASMVVSDGEGDYDSGLGSPRSAFSSRPGTASGYYRTLRSIGTASTLATKEEQAGESDSKSDADQGRRLRKFSASQREPGVDNMNAVDAAMTESSDKIGQRVLAIQQKLEDALISDTGPTRRRLSITSSSQGSDGDVSMKYPSSRPPRPPRALRLASAPPPRNRPRTAESTPTLIVPPLPVPLGGTTKEPGSLHKSHSTISLVTKTPLSDAVSPTTPSPVPATPSVTTDDSDTDFQSAYSASPRAFASDGDLELTSDPDLTLHNGVPTLVPDVVLDDFPSSAKGLVRQHLEALSNSLRLNRPRSSSTATTKTTTSTGNQHSPTMSETNTITSVSSQRTDKGARSLTKMHQQVTIS